MHSLGDLRFDFIITFRLQYSVAEAFSRSCDRQIEKPVNVVDGGIVQFRDQKKNKSCNSDPGPRRQCDFLAKPFANMIDPLVQEENRQTEEQAENGDTTQRNAYFHNVAFVQGL